MATILVVDDRPTNRDFLVTLLGYGGHRLLEAADGAEALALAKRQDVDLVIADILMPTVDGYELVRQMRADPSLARTAVIFYTAHYHEEEAHKLARACGVAHVLTKPCEPEVILRTVDAALAAAPQRDAPLDPPQFDREHLRLVTDKLSQKAEDLRRVNAQLTALVDLALELGAEQDPRHLLQRFCHAARNILRARGVVAALVEGDGNTLREYFTSGMNGVGVRGLDPRRGGPARVLSEVRVIRLRNPGGDPTALGFPANYPPIHAWLGAPIVAPGRVYGWLGLIDKEGAEEFSEEDERLAGMVAAQVGRVYENRNLYHAALQHAAKLEQEVAERERAEEAMRAAQYRLQHVVASSPAVLFTLAVTREQIEGISWISDNLMDVFGHPPHAALEPDWWQRNIHPEDRARVLGQMHAELFELGQTSHEYRFRHGDGGYRWTRGELRLIRSATGLSLEVVGSWSDVTDRRNLEDQFRQAQKMEAVGQLAGGVAHDFNNLLTVINGYGELLLHKLPEGDCHRELIREMVAAGNRAAGLTRQLLAFSRKAILEPRILDLQALTADVDKLLRRIIGEDIQLSVEADPDLGAVKADSGQLEQVILNLVVNARDAMPQGGRLTIELRNVELDETYTRDHPEARPGPHVMLAVSDTGCGIDSATLARIWEPFFTTKGVRGTGLGLATVHGIAKQSGGHVTAYSEVGHGTTFKVYLPRVGPRPALRGKSSQGTVVRGTETLLLVEDEDGVRALARRICEACGYTVLEAADGAEAVRVAREHAGKIDLLVTDVVLPRMGGRELAERVKAIYPDLKILFVSGYTNDAVVRHGILEAQVAFLQKPFSPSSLSAKVRAVLDAK